MHPPRRRRRRRKAGRVRVAVPARAHVVRPPIASMRELGRWKCTWGGGGAWGSSPPASRLHGRGDRQRRQAEAAGSGDRQRRRRGGGAGAKAPRPRRLVQPHFEPIGRAELGEFGVEVLAHLCTRAWGSTRGRSRQWQHMRSGSTCMARGQHMAHAAAWCVCARVHVPHAHGTRLRGTRLCDPRFCGTRSGAHTSRSTVVGFM